VELRPKTKRHVGMEARQFATRIVLSLMDTAGLVG
jgi:hypothetical protein